jgi:hypothetical protein
VVVLSVLLPSWGFDASMFNTADERSVAIATDVTGKIRLFLQVTPRALGLWFLDSPTAAPLVVASLSAALAIANFERDRRASAGSSQAGGVWPAAQRLGLVAMLVPLSVAPILLAQGSLNVYRHFIAYQWLIVLYLVAASMRLAATPAARRAVAAASLVAVLVAGIHAHWNFDRNLARINEKELQFIQEGLFRAHSRLPAHVVVIQPDATNLGSLGPLVERADEFGATTTMYPQDIPWIVFGAAAQLGLSRDKLLSVTGARADINGLVRIDAFGKVVSVDPLKSSDVVIDMRQFAARVRRGEF